MASIRPTTHLPPRRTPVNLTRVLVVGNNARFIETSGASLMSEKRIFVAGTAIERPDAIERSVLLRPDVVVIDINHKYELGGIETARAIQRSLPTANFVVVSPYREREYLAAFPAGYGLQWSYVLIESAQDPVILQAAVLQAGWGIQFIDPEIDRRSLGAGDAELDRTVRREPGKLSGDTEESERSRWRGVIRRFRPGAAEI